MTVAVRIADRLGLWQQGLYRALLPGIRRAELRRARREGRAPVARHLLTGVEGENHAFLHLVRHGYTVVARRWTTDRVPGDLDLVAYDGVTLVVFEVKTRTARDEYLAEERVDQAKRGHLRRLTLRLRREITDEVLEPPPVRFDILAVYLLDGAVEIEHYPNAFPLAPERSSLPHRAAFAG